ncbi:MAG: AraC family transcriptional regulator [Eubacteriales bacterium]
MNYYSNIQKAIEYIESNLANSLSLFEISDVSGYSIPHFYRIFGAMVGCTVKEYIRMRRLSNAVIDIITTKRSILDIALDCGYSSNEAFSRIVKDIYGYSPKQIRKNNYEPKLFEKINLLSTKIKHEVIIMEPAILFKGPITLIGISRQLNQGKNVKNNLISKIQLDFNGMVSTIKNRVNKDLFYSAYDYDPKDIATLEDDDINYTFYYCVEVSDSSDIPENMVAKVIPQAKYAQFTYDISEKTLNGEPLDMDIYDYIDGVWLPNSGFELSDSSDYEVINKANNTIEYYVSIK